MDLNTARHVLRIDPFTPLTPSMVEAAYAREAWERHPSRYPDTEGRGAAESWALTLAAARAALLGTAAVPTGAHAVPAAAADVAVAPSAGSDAWPPPTVMRATDASAGAIPNMVPVPVVARTSRRLSTGAVLGIVGGALALVALITGIGFGAASLSQRLAEIAPITTGAPMQSEEFADEVRYSAEETGFSFPSGLEQYSDGRLDGCPAKYLEGCWQGAVIPEASCGRLLIQYSFSNEIASSEKTRSTYHDGVAAAEVVELVFGDDDYEYGWVSDVVCIDNPGPATTT